MTAAPAAGNEDPSARTKTAAAATPLQSVQQWFRQRNWTIFPFQRDVWRAFARGESGLLHAGTGSGKTYALWFAAMLRALREEPAAPSLAGRSGTRTARAKAAGAGGLRVLWITPMRALAMDTVRALAIPAADLLPAWSIGLRTGDTGSAERARQNRKLPQTLVTTPESLTLLLTQAGAQARFAGMDTIIVDEWHELLGSKRGVQTQLALARLRRWRPDLLVWGLSATLGDLDAARCALLGRDTGVTIHGRSTKKITIDTLIPASLGRFPWGGHLGLQMLQPVIAEIEGSSSTLVFTNTRSQAELWYQHVLDARPDWAGLIALHHGSLDKSVREWVEAGLKGGTLKAVICTSSLDLGVDFLPVERVLQIGSCKGVARLLQRAGRSGHAPGRASRVTLVPTNSMELLEAAAARTAAVAGELEKRQAPAKPLDVLVQHLVTIAVGGGFEPDQLYEEVRTAWSYRKLTAEEWQWALDFVERGGQSLTAYPEYRRVLADEQGRRRVADKAIALRHRMSIGTIVSDAAIEVRFMAGARLGSVEESFISRMKPGDHFLFGGRMLEFVRLHEMFAYVRRASGKRGVVPRWSGGKMALSAQLGQAALAQLENAAHGRLDGPEMLALKPLLDLQARWSSLPTTQHLLMESLHSREGWHLFIYPFAGRSVHMGLAALLAWRIARRQPATFSIAVNDYGLELLCTSAVDYQALFAGGAGAAPGDGLLGTDNLLEDVLCSLNAGELAQRRFREIARIAGLVFQGYPGKPKSQRQVQASSSLFYEVFRKHDSGNLLLTQAQREVLEQELEATQLRQTLVRMASQELLFHPIARATPFGFPLLVERFREKLSTEKLSERVARMVRELEKAADKCAR